MFYSLELIGIPFTPSWVVCLGVSLPKTTHLRPLSYHLLHLRPLLPTTFTFTPFGPCVYLITPFGLRVYLFTPFGGQGANHALFSLSCFFSIYALCFWGGAVHALLLRDGCLRPFGWGKHHSRLFPHSPWYLRLLQRSGEEPLPSTPFTSAFWSQVQVCLIWEDSRAYEVSIPIGGMSGGPLGRWAWPHFPPL